MRKGKNPRIIKILFINHAAGWGGATISLISQIKNMDQTKYDIKVLLLKNSVVAHKFKENGVHTTIARSAFYRKYYHYFTHSEAGYVKWYQLFRLFRLSILWLLSRYYFAERELTKHNYDIVHLNSSALTDWLAPAKKRGRVVIHIREPFRKGKVDVLRPVFRKQMRKYADQIIAISKDNASRIGIPEKTTVIYNHYSDIPVSQAEKDSYLSKKALYLGGAMKIKGFYTMVNSLDHLNNDIKVLFAGSYFPKTKKKTFIKSFLKFILRYGKKKERAINKIFNHPNAIYLGPTTNIGVCLSEVCCLVSPFSSPHFARPVFEAHFHKKPVIGSDVEGMDEIIEHDINGLIVPKNDPKALAEAINMITSNSFKAKQLGENGYKTAIKKFTSANIKEVEDLYCSLIC